ncbi:hypothetical protein H0G77_07040 [[Pasteurella] aerogenes]|nr:hypothetical protein [[Pasteurella] aerogenes]
MGIVFINIGEGSAGYSLYQDIAGLIYRFGYLKTPIPDENTILPMPTLALFPYISLWGKMKNEHIAYWENFTR